MSGVKLALACAMKMPDFAQNTATRGDQSDLHGTYGNGDFSDDHNTHAGLHRF